MTWEEAVMKSGRKVNAVIRALACGAAFWVASVVSHAADLYCSGTVQYVLMYNDGTVALSGSWRGDYVYLCSTSGSWGSIPQEVCLAWYATAVKAADDGKHVAIYYSPSSYTCATLPTYSSAPVPFYFGVAP
jgi:hypothetical protein